MSMIMTETMTTLEGFMDAIGQAEELVNDCEGLAIDIDTELLRLTVVGTWSRRPIAQIIYAPSVVT